MGVAGLHGYFLAQHFGSVHVSHLIWFRLQRCLALDKIDLFFRAGQQMLLTLPCFVSKYHKLNRSVLFHTEFCA